MKRITRNNIKSSKNTQQTPSVLRNRVNEVGFMLLLALSVFLLAALWSYHPADPGWTHATNPKFIHNLTGRAGAWFADLSLHIFGYFAYLFPLGLVVLGIRLRQSKQEESSTLLIATRIAGTILLVMFGTGLINLHVTDPALEFRYHSGGAIGAGLSAFFLPIFSPLGTTLVFLSLFLTGFTLLTGISWVTIVDKTGEYTIKAMMMLTKVVRHTMTVMHKVLKEWAPKLKRQTSITPAAKPVFEAPTVRQAPKISVSPTTVTDDSPRKAPSFGFSKPTLTEVQDTINKPNKPVSKPKTKTKSVVKVDGMPDAELLDGPDLIKNPVSEEALRDFSKLVELKLKEFNIDAKVVAVYPGPVITRFELDLAPGIKVSRISNLVKDLARALSVVSVRIVEVIPGKPVIGLEVPNEDREVVRLSEVITSNAFKDTHSPLSLVLGKDISGLPVVVDLARMPHLLVAGTTGSGKSVGINAMLLSLLFKSTPEDVRLIMIDPKMLELAIYEGIPHLLAPVVTDMKEAANALRWSVAEMERRYKLMAALGVRNLAGFNQKVLEAEKKGEPILDPLWNAEISLDDTAPPLTKLPYIVVVIDEFADMMMIVGKKVEELIARIAQKARAAGIHLVLATQRPSVDVITGLIKANIPTRIAFQVSSKVDSRTILDQPGAEQLLGQGDMLYMPPGTGLPQRVHGAFVADHEVHQVVADWRGRAEPDYDETVLNGQISCDVPIPDLGISGDSDGSEQDPLYDEAVKIVTESRRASISSIQRRLKIGYNRAARMVEDMESAGVVSAVQSNGMREVIAPPPV